MVYVALVKTVLKSRLYSTTEVGYKYDLTSSPRGLTLELSGLSDAGIFQGLINQTMKGIIKVT